MTEQSQKNNNLKVGFTVFAGLVVLFVFIILIGTDDFLFSKTFNLYINIDNTAGLVNGAPVTLGGYKIGDIEAVDFVIVNSKTNIRVKLRIKNEYRDQIRNDSKVRITSIGILGDKFVDITIGNPGTKAIAADAFLEVEPTISIDNIAKNVAPGIEKFNKVMENIKDVTDSIAKGQGTVGTLINNPSTIAGLNRIVNKIDVALNTLEKKDGSLHKLLYDEELYNDLAATVHDVRMISEDLRKGKGTAGKLITDDSLYNSLKSSSMSLNDLLNAAQIDSAVVGGLIKDKKLYGNINELIKGLNELVTDIKLHPERYVNVSVF